MLNNIHKLTPSYIYKIWGGDKLSKIKGTAKGQSANNNPLGETWEVSIHKDGPSLIESDGSLLSDHFDISQIPYLVKFIDTSDNLSVQVHPGDEYAKEHENSMGKTECWLILDAKKDAKIYLGFKEGVSKDQFKQAINSKEDVTEYLRSFNVSSGDFFYVPSGSVHAIGSGVTLVEVQQSSGITYRVWDWNRLDSEGKSRELHVRKAMDVLNFEKECNSEEYFKIKRSLFAFEGGKELLSHRDFNLYLGNMSEKEKRTHSLKGKRAKSITCLNGHLYIEGVNETLSLDEFESAIISDTIEEISVSSDAGASYVLIS